MERAEESSEASKEDFRMKLKMNKAYEIVLLESSRMEADDKKIKNDKQKLFRMMKEKDALMPWDFPNKLQYFYNHCKKVDKCSLMGSFILFFYM